MTLASGEDTGRSSSKGTPLVSGGNREQRLKEAYEAALREYGSISLPFERFAHQVLDRLNRRLSRCGAALSEDRIDQLMSLTSMNDLFLAIACDDEVPGAWEIFIERFVPRLIGLARYRGYPDREAVQIAEAMPGELISRPGTGNFRSRLGTYEGAGRLFDWLAVIFIRKLQGLFRYAKLPRGARRLSIDAPVGVNGKDLVQEVPDRSVGSSEPLAQMIEQESIERTNDALRAGWRELTTSESLALLYKYEQQLRQKEIACLLGLSESRISRIVQKALHKIREHVVKSVPEVPFGALIRSEQFWQGLHAVAVSQPDASARSSKTNTTES